MFRRPSSALLVLAACGGAGKGTSPVSRTCPVDRIAAISGQEDVTKLEGCTSLMGLAIRTGAPLDLQPLHALEVVTGDVSVGPTLAMEELSLTGLRNVGGSFQVESNQLLRGVFLPRLESAGRISIAANSSLVTFAAPRLVTVTGTAIFSELASLEILDLSALVTVGTDLVVTDNPALGMLELPALASAQALRIEGNRALPAAQVEAVEARSRTTPDR